MASAPVIAGPVASGPRRAPVGRMLAGCLSGCAGAMAMTTMVLGSGLGMGWELLQPHHRSSQSVPDGTCSFDWWRGMGGGARYRIRCQASKELEVKQLKLLSGPAGARLVESVEDWGQRPWEDQRPMAGEVITIDAGRSWTYDGTISLGTVPWVGPPAQVTLSAILDEEPRVFRAGVVP